MKTRRNNKRPRNHGKKSCSKRQRGSGPTGSRPNIEEENPGDVAMPMTRLSNILLIGETQNIKRKIKKPVLTCSVRQIEIL